MLDLLLLRHAKAQPTAPGGDVARALNPRGRKAAALMAKHLAGAGLPRPDRILCSAATRTRETHAAVVAALGRPPPPTDFQHDLYLADPAQLVAALQDLDASVGCALVIGHNPGLHQLALALAGGPDEALLDDLRGKFPTATLAWLRFDNDSGWSRFGRRSGTLKALVAPRDLDPEQDED